MTSAPVRARDTPGRAPTPQQLDGLLFIGTDRFGAHYECYRPGCPTPREEPINRSALGRFIDGIKARHMRQYHGEIR